MTYFITTKTTADSKIRVLGTAEKRDVARSDAGRLGGTVRTQADIDKLIAAGTLDQTTLPGYVAPEPLLEIAKAIKAASRQRTTIGKKEKVLKRVVTPDDVVEAATAYAQSLTTSSKVEQVRKLASWVAADGKTRLQRRDMFAILRGAMADATIATQFQLVRSGKLVG